MNPPQWNPMRHLSASLTSTLALCLLAAAVLSLAGSAASAAAPASADAAFVLDTQGLHLRDARGLEIDRQPLRAKRMDSRPARGALPALAAVLDADLAQPRLWVTGPDGLRPGPALPALDLDIETLCLQQDTQDHRFLVVIGADGLAEQWLLRAQDALPVRRFTVPAGSQSCVADDASGWLYVATPALGVWRLDLGHEQAPALRPVALRAPMGPLQVAPHGLRLADRQLVVDDKAGRPLWHGAAAAAPQAALPWVVARAQTAPVARRGDAADDPAIWVHPGDPARSRVLGTNKKQGLLVYDLQGRERQLLPVGRINNVDLRQHVRAGAGWMDVAVATQRDEHALALFAIDAEGTVRDLGRVVTPLKNIYGVCTARGAEGDLQVFVNDKDGTLLHLRLTPTGTDGRGPWAATELRRLHFGSQPEGCVVDEAGGRVFLGEEDRGVWSLPLRADASGTAARPQLILPVGGLLQADTEGLALYDGPHGRYLVVSSQGNDSYVVLDAAPPHRLRGAFRIGLNAEAGIDGASETDGLEATARPLGPDYPQGLLVVQDGHKHLPDGPQNFKWVDWREVAAALQLP